MDDESESVIDIRSGKPPGKKQAVEKLERLINDNEVGSVEQAGESDEDEPINLIDTTADNAQFDEGNEDLDGFQSDDGPDIEVVPFDETEPNDFAEQNEVEGSFGEDDINVIDATVLDLSATTQPAEVVIDASAAAAPADATEAMDVDVTTTTLPNGSAEASSASPYPPVRQGKDKFLTFQEFERIFELAKAKYYNTRVLKQYTPRTAEVYGEALPKVVDQLVKVLNLSKDDIFYDIGSGIGNIVMQVAAQTGCKSMGIEIRPELDDITNSCYAYLNEEARQMGKVVGPCNFIIGDATSDDFLGHLTEATVIFMNNLCYPAEMQQKLEMMFKGTLKHNTRVICIKHLFPRGQLTARRAQQGLAAIFRKPYTQIKTGTDAVSWVAREMSFWMYQVDRFPQAIDAAPGSTVVIGPDGKPVEQRQEYTEPYSVRSKLASFKKSLAGKKIRQQQTVQRNRSGKARLPQLRVAPPPLASARIAANRQELTYDVVKKHALDFRGNWVVNREDDGLGFISELISEPNKLLVKANQPMLLFDSGAPWEHLVTVEEADVEPLPAPRKPKKVKQSRAAKAKRSYRPPAPRSSTLGLDSSKDDAMDVDIMGVSDTNVDEPSPVEPEPQQEALPEPDQAEQMAVDADATINMKPNGQETPLLTPLVCDFDDANESCKTHVLIEDVSGHMASMLQQPVTLRCLTNLVKGSLENKTAANVRSLHHLVVSEIGPSLEGLITNSSLLPSSLELLQLMELLCVALKDDKNFPHYLPILHLQFAHSPPWTAASLQLLRDIRIKAKWEAGWREVIGVAVKHFKEFMKTTGGVKVLVELFRLMANGDRNVYADIAASCLPDILLQGKSAVALPVYRAIINYGDVANQLVIVEGLVEHLNSIVKDKAPKEFLLELLNPNTTLSLHQLQSLERFYGLFVAKVDGHFGEFMDSDIGCDIISWAAQYGVGLTMQILAGEISYFLKHPKLVPLSANQVLAIRNCLIWSEDRESYTAHDEICAACHANSAAFSTRDYALLREDMYSSLTTTELDQGLRTPHNVRKRIDNPLSTAEPMVEATPDAPALQLATTEQLIVPDLPNTDEQK